MARHKISAIPMSNKWRPSCAFNGHSSASGLYQYLLHCRQRDNRIAGGKVHCHYFAPRNFPCFVHFQKSQTMAVTQIPARADQKADSCNQRIRYGSSLACRTVPFASESGAPDGGASSFGRGDASAVDRHEACWRPRPPGPIRALGQPDGNRPPHMRAGDPR